MEIRIQSTVQGETYIRKIRRYLKAKSERRAETRAYVQLLRMSHRDLTDMGLSHDQVRHELRRP